MPVVALRVGLPGDTDIKVMELISGIDYLKVHKFLSVYRSNEASASAPSIPKEELQQLLASAQSRREREQLKYAVLLLPESSWKFTAQLNELVKSRLH